MGEGPPLDLYLIECTSFRGNSGSPVFFYLGQDRKLGSFNLSAPIFKLAGVMKGYFGETSLLRVTDTAKIPYVSLNSGIGAVIPAYQLHEILFGKELKERRRF